LSTKVSSPHTNCQVGTFPNLGWLTLEKDTTGKPTGRLHVIGNEGDARGGPFKASKTSNDPFPPPFLFQDDWYDTAADGPVAATVELKPAFTSQFSGAKFLISGQADPVDLPTDGKVAALPAWTVVNMPDYMPDTGHFVSLWDLALNQAWNYVFVTKVKTVEGQHRLATGSDLSTYAFYDYYVHIHPQLGLFSDVAYASGQVRAGAMADTDYLKGVVVRGKLDAEASASDPTLGIEIEDALRIKVASLGQPFLVLLSANAIDPLSGAHEFVNCTDVDDSGFLKVTRGQQGTLAASWRVGTSYFAATKAGYIETPLLDSIPADATTIKVDVQSAHKMPEPTARDTAFKIAVSGADDIEWMNCTANANTKGELTVGRGVDGSAAKPWGLLQDNNPVVIATALGHKTLNARARINELDTLNGGPLQTMLFRRLRLPKTVYDRTTFKKHLKIPATATHAEIPESPDRPFPREYGRREQFGAISPGPQFHRAVNVDPGGSLARFHEVFVDQRRKSCAARSPLPPDTGKSLPDKLPDETYKEDLATHVTWLDDYYWIVSERDMPMLKELALTHMQFRHFQLWSNTLPDFSFNPEPKHLFQRLFKPGDPNDFFNQTHAMEEYIDRLFKTRARFAPAFIDMASMGKMLGGSFLPGIEVGREGGKPANWTLYQGGTSYFPDVRFQPQGSNTPHLPGTLTKDLAVPWFADYIDCGENFWPTSRPEVVFDANGLAYSWLGMDPHANNQADFISYWTKLGFIRRRQGDSFAEEEAIFHRP
jgi:hypothetical protein